ncbi:MAG: Mu-like prophage major head subunit gpT family protein [Rhizobiaceae bacterium]|nr:Mu-like prophage major head subunit gpT family protein [Rhizobiaceae bacterium]
MSRVNSPAGIPFLLAHDSVTPGARIGRVLSITIGKNDVRAIVQLGSSEAAEALVRDLQEIGVAISFGYRVSKWERLEQDDAPEIRVAKSIAILELSAVSIAADAGAHVRSENPMPTPANNRAAVTPPATDPVEDIESEVRVFGPAEKKALCERHGLDQAFYTRHARKTEPAFREAVLDALVEETQANHGGSVIYAGHNARTLDNPEIRVRAIGEALRHRLDPAAELSEPARQFAGMTVPEIARRCIEVRGEATAGMSPAQLVTRALHSTSDFPLILADTVNRTLRSAYMAAPSALKQLARKTTARDFKAKHSLVLSEGPELKKVNEHGEFTRGSFRESKESYRIDTFGRVFGITRQALINDDLSAFDQVPTKLGRAAEAFESAFLASLVESNPKMSDNKALFHADHRNLASSPAALDITPLSDARLAMRKQVGLAGELISVTPKFLLVPSELETIAEKLLATLAAAKMDDVNPFSKSLGLVVEPRLTSATAWYVSAATGEIDGLEYAYLEGYEGPVIESRAGFDIDGVEIKVRLDFGAGFVDHRGWYKNAGSSPG